MLLLTGPSYFIFEVDSLLVSRLQLGWSIKILVIELTFVWIDILLALYYYIFYREIFDTCILSQTLIICDVYKSSIKKKNNRIRKRDIDWSSTLQSFWVCHVRPTCPDILAFFAHNSKWWHGRLLQSHS